MESEVIEQENVQDDQNIEDMDQHNEESIMGMQQQM